MAPTFSRRRLLGSTAAAAAASLLPPSLRAALAAPAPRPDSLSAVEHVVILMQENRSFDTYFGTLRGVDGFDDPDAITLSNGRSVFYQPDAFNPDGYELPFHLDTKTTNAAATVDLSHAWDAQHYCWHGGKLDAWVPTHRLIDGFKSGPMTMGYYTRADLPFYYALADAFTICDHYHCSVLGPTSPNRLYALTGTIDPAGLHGGPALVTDLFKSYSWTTYAERLQRAGVSWRVYQTIGTFGDNALSLFKQFQTAPRFSPLWQNGMRTVPNLLDALQADVDADNLPQVSWIVPEVLVSEHPPLLPASGASFNYKVLEVLASNPAVWNKTVVFLTYDENGGYFDHVPPPTAPLGTPGEYISVRPLPPDAKGIAGPIGLGFRVPMIVISPWSQGGYVNSEVFDHTSMLRFMEELFGVEEPNISAWRRRIVGDLTSTLRLRSRARSFPFLPDPSGSVAQELWNALFLPDPKVPSPQSVPHQEPGSRPHD